MRSGQTTASPASPDDPADSARPRGGWSLGAYFALLVALFVAVAAGAAIYVSIQAERDARVAALRSAAYAAHTASQELGNDVATIRTTAAGLAANPQLPRVFTQSKGCTLTFGGSGAFPSGYLDIVRPNGTVACSSRPRPGASYAGAAWLRQARQRPLLLAPAPGTQTLLATVPIPGGGVVAVFASLRPVAATLARMFRSGRPAEFLVTSADGRTVIARSAAPRRWIGARVATTSFDPASTASDRTDVTGTRRLYREAAVPKLGWRLYVGEDRGVALAPGIQLRNRELAIIGGGLAIVLLAALLIYRRIALPLKRLAAAVRATDPYDPDVAPVAVAGPAELTALGNDIDELVGSIGQELRQRHHLEEQLRHAQKMDALGRVAAGVAHDFNNLVTIIAGFTSLLLKSVSHDDRLRGHAEEVGRAAERAAVLIRQLLLFSRKEKLQPTALDGNDLVGDMEGMLRRILGEAVQLTSRLAADPAIVSADRGQLEQVLLNLAVNARDAMPSGGTLILTTATVDLDPEAADAQALEAGRYLTIAVADDGVGMDGRTQARLFEPFFTTKPAGQGTGLGLATCYGIVSELGGKIDVASALGEGSTFTVYLPLAEVAPERALAAPPEPAGSAAGRTVLVVEDDADLRALIRTVLDDAGYTILEARFGEEAMFVADRHESPIDLLLTDSVMPVMSGRELAERFLQIHPHTAVLFMSGYDHGSHPGEAPPEDRYLAKPFTPSQLIAKVQATVPPPKDP